MKRFFKIPDDYPGFFSPWKRHSPGWKLLPRWLRSVRFAVLLITVLLAILIVQKMVVSTYFVPTGSMKNTLMIGDVFLVNKLAYGLRTPDWLGIPGTRIRASLPVYHILDFSRPTQNDVVIFKHPWENYNIYVKRVVAVENQQILIKRGRVYVDSIEIPLPPEAKIYSQAALPPEIIDPTIYPDGIGNRDNYGPANVPNDHVFVLGDNRNSSSDSRYWGFLPEKLILGKATMIIYSNGRIEASKSTKGNVRWSRLGKWIF